MSLAERRRGFLARRGILDPATGLFQRFPREDAQSDVIVNDQRQWGGIHLRRSPLSFTFKDLARRGEGSL